MALEIERKFLVKNQRWKRQSQALRCRQGYLYTGPPTAVRVRIINGVASLTLKSSVSSTERAEYEYNIPLSDAEEILATLCDGTIVEKTRHIVIHQGLRWEIDVFEGLNKGLVIAELELEDVHQKFQRPDWLGEEVSDDPRYLNACLARHPYASW